MKLSPAQQAQFDEMTMAEKIAILLLQLGEDVTANVFANLSVEAITEVSKYIAASKSIERGIATSVLEEFYAIFQSNQYISSGGLEYAREIGRAHV